MEAAASESPITHDGKTSGWTKKTWYKYYMKYGEYEYESIHDMFPYYRAVDINGDGVKELILTQTSNPADSDHNYIKIMILYKNKIRIMKSIDTSKIPSTCVSTISIGTEAIKKKYAICAANPA